MMNQTNTSLSRCFWAKVCKDSPVPECAPHLGPCWLWTARLCRDGYGQFDFGCRARNNKRTVSAYSLAWEDARGPLRQGLVLDHLCRVRRCVNPIHLEAVSHTENMSRGAWAMATHCIYGHEFTEENTSVRIRYGRPRRDCRACWRRRESMRPVRSRSAAGL